MKKRRPFTSDDDNYLRRNKDKSITELSKFLDRNYNSVYTRLVYLGLYHPSRYSTHSDKQKMLHMYKRGMSMVDIAIQTGWSYGTVRNMIHKYLSEPSPETRCELGQKTEPYYETERDLENSFNLVYLPSDLKGEELEIYKELIKP